MKTTLSTIICIIAFLPFLVSQPVTDPNTDVALATDDSSTDAPNYEPNNLLVYFDEGTPLKFIDNIKTEFGATEIWISPLSKTRYWSIPEFGQTYDFGDDTYTVTDIVDALEGISRRSNGDDEENEGNGGTGLSYTSRIHEITTTGASEGCYDDVNLHFQPGFNVVFTGICDSGYIPSIDPNPASEYNPLIHRAFDLIDASNNAIDHHGHGNHILSLIENTAYTANNFNFKPIRHIVARMLDEGSNGNLANLIYATEDAIVSGAEIINLSLGFMSHHEKNGFLRRMFDEVIERNVLVVIAAGNESLNVDQNKEYMPASFTNSNIITVASINCRSELSDFSNYGHTTVDIAAPGENMVGYDHNGELVIKSGTSQATAVVSGVAAILATHQSVFNGRAIKCALLAGSDVNEDLANKVRCSGVVNVDFALEYLLTNGTDNCEPIIALESATHQNTESTLKSLRKKPLTISPNPFNNSVSISNFNDVESINIYNALGKKMSTILNSEFNQSAQIELNLENYESGLYIFYVKSHDQIKSYKVIKQ